MVRDFLVNNFNIVVIICVILGLIIPGLEHLPKSSAMFLISTGIFFSCSNVSINELRHINIKSAIKFYVVRFLLFPVPIYYLALYLFPEYALGVLLVLLAPVGVSATALSGMLKANTSLVLSATVITSMLVPLIMPLIILYLVGSEIEIDVLTLFIPLGLGIFVPIFMYFGIVRRFNRAKSWVKRESELLSSLSVAVMLGIVTASQKEHIFSNVDGLFLVLAIGFVLFAFIYGIAFLFSFRMTFYERKTYMICSAVNNTPLIAGISVMYFSAETTMLCVLIEVPWIVTTILLKRYVDKHDE